MTTVIRAADHSMALHRAGSLGFNIVIACLMLFTAIYYPNILQDFVSIMTVAFWLLGSFSTIYITCFGGVLVTVAVSVNYSSGEW